MMRLHCSALNSNRSRFFAAVLSCLLVTGVDADALDAAVKQDGFLAVVAEALAAYDIDVTSNLNDRDVVGQRIRRPRLGRFPDLPLDSLPSSAEIDAWEAEYLATQIGGIAIIANGAGGKFEAPSEFLHEWLETTSADRLFITFYLEDLPAAAKIASVASAYDFSVQLFSDGKKQPLVGNLFATAAQRLAIDTQAARRYSSQVTELGYLSRRVRKNTESLFVDEGNKGESSLARREPAVFLKQTLGDAFNQSTIREVVVPGGVALGASAELSIVPKSLIFAEGRWLIIDDNEVSWQLPPLDQPGMKALFDFVQRSQSIKSDAIVDIDADGRVRISTALRDTEVGYQIMHADTQPFKYVPNLPVTKSVVIDIDVSWFPSSVERALEFDTGYEVRFLSADNMRIAQTRVALEYQYHSATDGVAYKNAWGRDVRRLHDNLDYAGLGNSLSGVANYAGWIGLLRKLEEDRIPFLQGRYEFMKIDKRGHETPARY